MHRTYSQLLPLRLHDCQRSSSNRLHKRIIMKLSNDRRHHRIPFHINHIHIKSGIKKRLALSFSCDTLFFCHRKKCTPLSPFNKQKSMSVACNNLQTFDTQAMLLQSIDNFFPFFVILGWYLQSLFLSISQTTFFCLYVDVYIGLRLIMLNIILISTYL